MSAPQAGIPQEIVREHVQRLCDLMARQDVAAMITFHPSNMLAFTGTSHSASDRLVCGVVTRDGAVMVICPAFEEPGVLAETDIPRMYTWREHEDPYATVAAALADSGVRSGRIGLDGRVWIDAWTRFQAALPHYKLYSGEAFLREVRICKSVAEIDVMQLAHRRGERVLMAAGEMIRAGMTEVELREALAARVAPDGLRASPMVQTGPNAAIPHHGPDDTPLAEGHTVVIDSVTTTSAYFNDLTRTYAVGEPSPRAREAYRVVRAAQQAAIAAARPGVPCGELDGIARGVIEQAGFGEYFTHRLGHGIGLECHEPPYLVRGNDEPLRAGMCVTVEPGIYVPGEFGIRIEDDIVITDDGCRVISGKLATDLTDAFEG